MNEYIGPNRVSNYYFYNYKYLILVLLILFILVFLFIIIILNFINRLSFIIMQKIINRTNYALLDYDDHF